MYKELSHLMIYSDTEGDSILYRVGKLYSDWYKKDKEKEELIADSYRIVRDILDISTSCAFEENLWTSYLTYYIISSENSFAQACERRGAAEGSINEFAKHDFE